MCMGASLRGPAAQRSAATQAFFTPRKGQQARRLRAVHVAATAEHAFYMNEVAMVAGSPRVETLIKVLEAQGQEVVSPASRGGLHPLAIPLTRLPGGDAGDGLTCLLRWAEGHRGMELPVVRMARNGTCVTLLARSVDEYMHRALVEEESGSGGGAGPVAEAAGAAGESLYAAGDLGRSGLPSLQAYLTKRVGLFPDVCEALALGHLSRGDLMSALITGEWYMRDSHFPGWGRPHEFNCGLMRQAGRPEESRDVARVALRMPWYSFSGGYAPLRDLAGLSGDAAAVRDALEAQDDGMSAMPGMKTNVRSERQQHMEEAEHLMNRAAAGEVGWDDVRPAVAGKYADAGLTDIARFILA